jgi:hypothetical protein
MSHNRSEATNANPASQSRTSHVKTHSLSSGLKRVRAVTKLFAGGWGGFGDRPASPSPPVVLAAGEACGAVADGGLSTRKGKGRKSS